MAVRFNNTAGKYFRRTSSLPSSSTMTIMFWVRLVSDLNTYAPFFYRTANSANPYIYLGTDADGTTLLLDSNARPITGNALSTGTWYHIAYVLNGSSHTVYLNGVSNITLTEAFSPTNDEITIGHTDSNDNVPSDTRFACIKIWDAALTAAEIQQEMYVIRPARYGNLYGFYPVFAGSGQRARDYSGLGHDFTEGGTLTDEDPPPVTWGAPVMAFPILAAGQTIAVNQVTETDAAQTLARVKKHAASQNTETDLSQAVTRVKRYAVVQNTESETAQQILARKFHTVNQVTETNTAQAITRFFNVQTIPVNQAAETETSQSLTARKARAVAQVTETDTAQSPSVRKMHSVGQVTETEIAQPVTKRKIHSVLQVTETDMAQAVAKVKHAGVLQVTEIDFTQGVTLLGKTLVGQANETDLAQPLTKLKIHGVALVGETETAQMLTVRKMISVGLVVETDAAQVVQLGGKIQVPVNQVMEVDAAQAITIVIHSYIGRVIMQQMKARQRIIKGKS